MTVNPTTVRIAVRSQPPDVWRDRESGSGCVVHIWNHAHPPAGGLSGDASRAWRVQAHADGILHAQSGAGRAGAYELKS